MGDENHGPTVRQRGEPLVEFLCSQRIEVCSGFARARRRLGRLEDVNAARRFSLKACSLSPAIDASQLGATNVPRAGVGGGLPTPCPQRLYRSEGIGTMDKAWTTPPVPCHAPMPVLREARQPINEVVRRGAGSGVATGSGFQVAGTMVRIQGRYPVGLRWD